MVFLIGFTIWSLFRVNDEITKFTQGTAVTSPVLDPTQFEQEFVDLSQRLDGFAAQIQLDEKAEAELTATQLNLAIASHDLFKELRGSFFIQKITPAGIEAQISYKLNGQPLGDGSPRYLNGTLFGKPVLDGGQVLLETTRIESLKGIVPEEFVAHLADHQITAPYAEHETMGPIMKKLTSITTSDGKLILTADPAVAPPLREVTDEEVADSARRGVMIFLSVVIIMIVFLVVFLRPKNKPSTPE